MKLGEKAACACEGAALVGRGVTEGVKVHSEQTVRMKVGEQAPSEGTPLPEERNFDAKLLCITIGWGCSLLSHLWRAPKPAARAVPRCDTRAGRAVERCQDVTWQAAIHGVVMSAFIVLFFVFLDSRPRAIVAARRGG